MTTPQAAQPPQAYIQVSVAEALSRIEAKLDGALQQMAGKADASALHELESRVRVLENSQASQGAVTQALGRAKTGIWVAVGALAAAASAVGYIIVLTRGR